VLSAVPAEAVQHLRNQREPPPAILASIDELLNLIAKLGRRIVANQATRAVEDLAVAKVIDFGLNLLDAASQTRGQAVGIKNGSGVAMEEHDDIPRQKGSDVALDEPRDCGSQDPLKVVQAVTRPLDERWHVREPGPESASRSRRHSACNLTAV
jgi:hypothetical protein